MTRLPRPRGRSLLRLSKVARLARKPLERFLQVEAASGVILLACAMIALVAANSASGPQFLAFWQTPRFALPLAGHEPASVRWLVNDVLMVLFFFVAGLEIRREVHHGELSEWRRAALPFFAALGGMVAPALLYLLVARTPALHQGWGVPMATDIAFAVGILALLGRRVPAALRVLLLALAVIDDLGAILVIAVWYSGTLHLAGLGLALAAVAAVWLLQRAKVRAMPAYLVAGVAMWAGTLAAGLHPTLAGVALGLLTPVELPPAWQRPSPLAPRDQRQGGQVPDNHGHRPLGPGPALIAALHPWVAYLIMPLFALANAGVALPGSLPHGAAGVAMWAVAIGLAAGKPLGVGLACWASVRLGWTALPAGLTGRHLLVLGTVAGVGFTMSLFVAQLAFAGATLLDAAKLGVLAGSGVSALAALACGWLLLRAPRPAQAATMAADADEAEASAER